MYPIASPCLEPISVLLSMSVFTETTILKHYNRLPIFARTNKQKCETSEVSHFLKFKIINLDLETFFSSRRPSSGLAYGCAVRLFWAIRKLQLRLLKAYSRQTPRFPKQFL